MTPRRGPGPQALRDRPAIEAADLAGLLPAAASAGAQVRAMAREVSQLPRADRPRSFVVVGPSAAVDLAVLSAVLGDRVAAPLVAATALPGWVGPLDTVVVLAGHRDDEAAALAAATGIRRGATTVVRAATDGPVAHAAAGALIGVEMAVPEALAGPARWSLLAGVAASCGLGPEPDLARLADLLDATALAVHPAAESFLNPAVNLAEILVAGVPILIGTDPVAEAVAGHAAAVFAELAGVGAAALTARQALAPAMLAALGGGRDVFADPFEDADPDPRQVPVLLSTADPDGPYRSDEEAGQRALSALRRVLPGAALVVASGSGPSGLTDPSRDPGPDLEPRLVRPGRPAGPDLLGAALALALQLDTAAVYLAVVDGRDLPADYPDGLGHSGGTRWSVRAADSGRDHGTTGK